MAIADNLRGSVLADSVAAGSDKYVVTVVIPAHNAADVIGGQLEALASQMGAPPFQVVVVLNCCSDSSFSVVQRYSERLNLRVISANGKPSAGYARNTGARMSSGRFFLFCDADDVVDRRWIAEMVKAMDDGNADLVGGLIEVDRSHLPDTIYTNFYESMDNRCLHGSTIPYAMSAAFGVTAEAFQAAHGFDERFLGAGGEDIDLCVRLLRMGYRIGAAPEARLRYSPRRTIHGVLSQRRQYARGYLMHLENEGTLGDPERFLMMVRSMVRGTTYQAIRNGNFNLEVFYANGRALLSSWKAHRNRAKTSSFKRQIRPEQFDFVPDLSVPIVGGLALSAANPNTANWYQSSGCEPASLALLERFLPSNGVFVDVGANIGVFTIAAAKVVGSGGSVIAFEPASHTATLLRRNIVRHNVLDVVEVRVEAVGDVQQKRLFRHYENELVSGFGIAPDIFFPGKTIEESEVSVVTLSQVVGRSVDMIKIDVEGYEAGVLRGAKELLKRSPTAVVLLEFNPACLAAAGQTIDEVLALLPEAQWDLWLVEEHVVRTPELQIVPFDRLHSSSHGVDSPGWFANILATPKVVASNGPQQLNWGNS